MGISKRKLHAEQHILPWRPLTDLRHENDTFAWNKASFIAQEGGGWVPEPLESSHGYATEKGQKHTLSHDHLLLMTSYLLTIGTEYHYTAVLVSKCALGINEQPLNTSGADVLSSRENIKKTSDGGGGKKLLAVGFVKPVATDFKLFRQSDRLANRKWQFSNTRRVSQSLVCKRRLKCHLSSIFSTFQFRKWSVF